MGKDTFGGEDPQIASQITRIKALPKQPDFFVHLFLSAGRVSAMRQLRAAGVNLPMVGSESWDGDYWLEAVPNLSDIFFVTYGSVFGNDSRPEWRHSWTSSRPKVQQVPVTSHAITGYSVIQAWSRAVEQAGTFDTDKVRDALQAFKDEPLAGRADHLHRGTAYQHAARPAADRSEGRQVRQCHPGGARGADAEVIAMALVPSECLEWLLCLRR